MADLKLKKLIVIKGLLFALLALGSSSLIFLELPSARIAFLLCLVAWSSARFYYFLFYVLEKYVDPTLKYAGIIALEKVLSCKRD